MINRSALTMFNNHRVPRSCTNVEFIEAAIDHAVENCQSPKGILLLALASITVTGVGLWALTKFATYLEDDLDADQDHASEHGHSSGNRM